MQTRWILSRFYRNAASVLIPVAADYGANWFCPTNPAADDGWALVLINIDPHQVDAAAQDTRLVVCPLVFDPSVIPSEVVSTYASWGGNGGHEHGRTPSQTGRD